jgi:NTP pyrophosphatase (non-canonical NTP hydrolase)
MSLREVQQRVDGFIQQQDVRYFQPLTLVARLAEEVGEIAREVNHAHGEKPKKASERPGSITEELGDLLFVVASLANSLEIDLDAAFDDTMRKVETRDKDRWKRRGRIGGSPRAGENG